METIDNVWVDEVLNGGTCPHLGSLLLKGLLKDYLNYMKILSNTEYEALVAEASQAKTSDVDKVIEELERKHRLELDAISRQNKNDKEDADILLKRTKAEQDLVVQKTMKDLNDKVQELILENGNYKKEVEILTKAFENMGFDVKDMKEILNKLVDGIVSKNSIQLVK
jgi:predicted DsbA family dithiol-disulfide isomerase